MILKGLQFGPVFSASGALGFFGEGYPYHKWMKWLTLGRFSFEGCTLVAKTTTLRSRVGNMPLKNDGITPREFLPNCIWFNHRKAIALNAVGLSGPGAEYLFQKGEYQKLKDPFMLSFMPEGNTAQDRFEESFRFAQLVKEYLVEETETYFGIQINISCPNIKQDYTKMRDEIEEILTIIGGVLPETPLMPKYNILIPPEVIAEIDRLKHCAGHCATNSIPWRANIKGINWEDLFSTEESPLSKRGYDSGGLSGRPLLKPTGRWIQKCRHQGVEKPINAGGGVLKPADVNYLRSKGASSVFVGSVAFLRPWRLQPIINRAYEVFNQGGFKAE